MRTPSPSVGFAPREECLDLILILNQTHLRRVLNAFNDHYKTARPHRGLAQWSPIPRQLLQNSGPVQRRELLGGIIGGYYSAPDDTTPFSAIPSSFCRTAFADPETSGVGSCTLHCRSPALAVGPKNMNRSHHPGETSGIRHAFSESDSRDDLLRAVIAVPEGYGGGLVLAADRCTLMSKKVPRRRRDAVGLIYKLTRCVNEDAACLVIMPIVLVLLVAANMHGGADEAEEYAGC